jgi:excisionase family DNA binding protein
MSDKETVTGSAAPPDIMTMKEAATFLKIHPKTLNKLALAKKVPAVRIGRSWRFSRLALEAKMGVPKP